MEGVTVTHIMEGGVRCGDLTRYFSGRALPPGVARVVRDMMQAGQETAEGHKESRPG